MERSGDRIIFDNDEIVLGAPPHTTVDQVLVEAEKLDAIKNQRIDGLTSPYSFVNYETAEQARKLQLLVTELMDVAVEQGLFEA